jgi:hypothetical protein
VDYVLEYMLDKMKRRQVMMSRTQREVLDCLKIGCGLEGTLYAEVAMRMKTPSSLVIYQIDRALNALAKNGLAKEIGGEGWVAI